MTWCAARGTGRDIGRRRASTNGRACLLRGASPLQEAFLLGHVQTTVTETLSDADVPVKQTFVRYRMRAIASRLGRGRAPCLTLAPGSRASCLRAVGVHSFKVLPDVYAFYNQAGAVDMPAVERLLGDDLPVRRRRTVQH